jgi:hypothetical protein
MPSRGAEFDSIIQGNGPWFSETEAATDLDAFNSSVDESITAAAYDTKVQAVVRLSLDRTVPGGVSLAAFNSLREYLQDEYSLFGSSHSQVLAKSEEIIKKMDAAESEKTNPEAILNKAKIIAKDPKVKRLTAWAVGENVKLDPDDEIDFYDLLAYVQREYGESDQAVLNLAMRLCEMELMEEKVDGNEA